MLVVGRPAAALLSSASKGAMHANTLAVAASQSMLPFLYWSYRKPPMRPAPAPAAAPRAAFPPIAPRAAPPAAPITVPLAVREVVVVPHPPTASGRITTKDTEIARIM